MALRNYHGYAVAGLPPLTTHMFGDEIKLPQWPVVKGARLLELSAEADVSLEDYPSAAGAFFRRW